MDNEHQETTNMKGEKKKKKKRCAFADCRKKLQLTDMSCHCKSIFCQIHRLPETHNCSWNPKNESEMVQYKNIAGLNQAVLFSKIERI